MRRSGVQLPSAPPTFAAIKAASAGKPPLTAKVARRSAKSEGFPIGLFGPLLAARFRHLHPRFQRAMRAVFLVIDLALEIYIWIVIAMAIFSWLVAFNVVNTRSPVVHTIGDFLYRITDPVLRPIRNVMPNLGGIDISPVILFLIIVFIRYVIALYILPNVY